MSDREAGGRLLVQERALCSLGDLSAGGGCSEAEFLALVNLMSIRCTCHCATRIGISYIPRLPTGLFGVERDRELLTEKDVERRMGPCIRAATVKCWRPMIRGLLYGPGTRLFSFINNLLKKKSA